MPELTKVFRLDVTPEIFIQRCSVEELIELELLLSSPSIQQKIKLHNDTVNIIEE